MFCSPKEEEGPRAPETRWSFYVVVYEPILVKNVELSDFIWGSR